MIQDCFDKLICMLTLVFLSLILHFLLDRKSQDFCSLRILHKIFRLGADDRAVIKIEQNGFEFESLCR